MDVKKLAEEIIAGKRLTRQDDLSFFLTCDLKELQEEKEELEKSTSEVFKEEDVEEVFQKQQEVNIALNSEISELEDKIIKLENSIISLREEYNKLVKENKIISF